jgi:hypothetical protein
MGVDFTPYLHRVLQNVKETWLPLIPKEAKPPVNKEGKAVIEFAILRDGSVASGMKLAGSSSDLTLARAAWGSITAANPFPPLPKEFGGNHLALRFYYYYNIAPVSISPAEATALVESSVQFHALQNEKDATVTWSIQNCDDGCGTISDTGVYTAPAKIPSAHKVTISGSLTSDPGIRGQATVTVVAPGP